MSSAKTDHWHTDRIKTLTIICWVFILMILLLFCLSLNYSVEVLRCKYLNRLIHFLLCCQYCGSVGSICRKIWQTKMHTHTHRERKKNRRPKNEENSINLLLYNCLSQNIAILDFSKFVKSNKCVVDTVENVQPQSIKMLQFSDGKIPYNPLYKIDGVRF